MRIPQCIISLEFTEILSQNYLCYHCWLSVSEITKMTHFGILINMPYWLGKTLESAIKGITHSIDGLPKPIMH